MSKEIFRGPRIRTNFTEGLVCHSDPKIPLFKTVPHPSITTNPLLLNSGQKPKLRDTPEPTSPGFKEVQTSLLFIFDTDLNIPVSLLGSQTTWIE